jgi:hypothetical protein
MPSILDRIRRYIFLFAAIDGSKRPHTTSKCKRVKSVSNSSNLSLFKGREAKLNRIILIALFQGGPMVVYDITKVIKKRRGFKLIRYSNVNRRVRALADQGYLEVVGSRATQSGSLGALYQPTIRAKVAFYLNAVDADTFVREANDEALTTELAALALYFEKDNLE